jgi:hypothetical protein
MGREEDLKHTMTVRDFAKWLLTLPKEDLNKEIWFIDITYPFKDKPLNTETSPSGTHLSIEDIND